MKDGGGRILLLSEGATIVMFGRLVLNEREFAEKFLEPVHKYADEVTAHQKKLIEEVSNKFERNLICLGATALEGKFENGGS